MTSPLANLEPKFLWTHFDQLRQIPRPSRKEERVRAHVEKWATEHGYEVRKDAIGNICVVVPPSAGHEKARVVTLQGHLDMVAEKDAATVFDFDNDPIPVCIQGDWLVAEHTTLGADNGIGVAASMAAADDPDVVHGPLELLFTIDEETALTGASHLDGSIVKGRMLLNLDSEEDGTLFVGCAGGTTSEISFDLARAKVPEGYTALAIEVSGLKGGHSGLAIHENRGNSLKLLARVLGAWLEEGDLRLDHFEGGNKHNAIPREAKATVVVRSAFVAQAKELAEAVRKSALTEIATIDPGLELKVSDAAMPYAPATADCSARLVRMLVAMPHGVVTMSRDIAGLTETSTNLAVAHTTSESVEIISSSRSSVAPALRFTLDSIAALVNLAGGTVNEVGAYPGWQPNMASPLLKTCRSVYRDLRSQDAKVTAIHAGLECGLIGEKLGVDADMISFGPHLEGVHAPGEKVNIPSVGRFWEYFKAVLLALA